ncbi:uncharacterized protein LOC133320742 [Danaus plexippus]|uniref:uncharacterized protein LOC133320742 n=1 Tax=Danaus plexippus TaxID=13037 RepID=UPI002AB1B710|nr:uncharacterized protein LOC133320742 [Danaus plexippus]
MIAISIGSNAEPLEARMNYINQAFEYLVNAFYPPLASSGLYESITAYVQNPSQLTVYDQLIKYKSSFFGDTKYTACPSHLNAVFIFELVYESPEEVLDILQNIEERMGRDRKYSDIFDKFGICKPDNKPFQAIRPIDIDLLLYKGKNINTSRLTVPHSRMHERLFILYPLNDALSFNHLLQDKLNYPIHDVLKKLENNVKDRPIKVFPVQESKLWAFGSKTLPKIMGILNVTDNSFTDGGKYLSLDAALLKAEEMIHYGAQIIDVGGESSAPGNARVSTETELSRVIPRWPDILISVDTTKSAVLREAVKAGANILNDISGGTDDEDMLYTAKELKCIVILGHRKGSSLTMNNLATKTPPRSRKIQDTLKSEDIEKRRELIAAAAEERLRKAQMRGLSQNTEQKYKSEQAFRKTLSKALRSVDRKLRKRSRSKDRRYRCPQEHRSYMHKSINSDRNHRSREDKSRKRECSIDSQRERRTSHTNHREVTVEDTCSESSKTIRDDINVKSSSVRTKNSKSPGNDRHSRKWRDSDRNNSHNSKPRVSYPNKTRNKSTSRKSKSRSGSNKTHVKESSKESKSKKDNKSKSRSRSISRSIESEERKKIERRKQERLQRTNEKDTQQPSDASVDPASQQDPFKMNLSELAMYYVDSEPDPLDEFMQEDDPVMSISLDEVLDLQKQIADSLTKSEAVIATPIQEDLDDFEDIAKTKAAEEAALASVMAKENETTSSVKPKFQIASIDEKDDEIYHQEFIAQLKKKQVEAQLEEDKKRAEAEAEAAELQQFLEEKNEEEKEEDRDEDKENMSLVPVKDEDEFLDDAAEDDYRYNVKVGSQKELPNVDHSKINYMPFNKNLYVQVREITLMKDHEVDALRKLNNNIKIRGKNCPRPIKTFYQCGLPDVVLKIIEKREYQKLFPIQMQALPTLMAGRDTLGIAETGSGKTLAYLLPLLRHILDQPPLRPGEGPIGLILAPTRELTVQIHREVHVFAKPLSLISVPVYGGTGIGSQLSALKRGAYVVVATPGRLIDVLTINNGKIINLRRVTFVILDEADRMFDMGFEPQIMSILKTIRPDAQKALFSATFPPYIESLAKKIMKKPIEIVIGERQASSSKVEQFVEIWNSPREKFLRLLQLLGEWAEHGSIIIFISRQSEADELFADLLRCGYASLVLHGGQDQTDRDFTIHDFKENVANILIATSVAARGLDVKSIVLVINYCAPDHLEDYIHRIGRTGRADNIGVAYTFLSNDDADKAEDLIRALKQADKPIPLALKQLADSYKLQLNMGLIKQHGKGGFKGKGFKFTATEKSRQQQERLQAKKELGLEGSDEDEMASEIFDDLENPMSPIMPQPVPNTDDVGAASVRAKSLADLVNKTESSKDIKNIIQQKLNAISPAISSLAQKNLALAAAAAAVVNNNTVSPQASKSSLLTSNSYIDSQTGNLIEEFDINDYPQNARFKVTHKDVLNRITDQTGAVLQVKGRYVAPDEKDSVAMLGVKRLYIEIIGSTPIIVQHAKHELRSLLESVSIKQLNMPASARATLGRYTVI